MKKIIKIGSSFILNFLIVSIFAGLQIYYAEAFYLSSIIKVIFFILDICFVSLAYIIYKRILAGYRELAISAIFILVIFCFYPVTIMFDFSSYSSLFMYLLKIDYLFFILISYFSITRVDKNKILIEHI